MKGSRSTTCVLWCTAVRKAHCGPAATDAQQRMLGGKCIRQQNKTGGYMCLARACFSWPSSPPLGYSQCQHAVVGCGGAGLATAAPLAPIALLTLLDVFCALHVAAQLWRRPAVPHARERLAATADGGLLEGVARTSERSLQQGSSRRVCQQVT